jgi:non-specific serine/threonine protein kinase
VKLALEWFNQSADTDGLARLASALGDFWLLHGHYQDRRRWLAIADKATCDHVSHVRVAVLVILAVHYSWLGEHEQAIASSERALVMARELRDHGGIYHAAARSGIAAGRPGQFERAQDYQFEALAAARRLDDESWSANAISSVYGHLGNIELSKGDIDAADRYFDQALDEQRRQGYEPGTSHLVACHPIGGMGDAARARGELPLAFERYRRYLELAWKASDARAIGVGLGGVAGTLAAAGRWQEAARQFGASEAFFETASIPFDQETIDRQRALGLPEPWQRPDESFGQEVHLRQVVFTLNPVHYADIPDVEAAARFLSEGRLLSVPDAIAEIAQIQTAWPESRSSSPDVFAGLTGRETEVLRLICEGKSEQEIGEALFVTRRTAATHVSSVLHKLGVKSRAAAAVWAVRNGVCL